MAKFSSGRYNLLKSIFQVGKENGLTSVYRHKALKQYSRIVRESDPTHTDTTRGDHIGDWMEQIAKELGGKLNKDLTKNGNAKKNSVRIDF